MKKMVKIQEAASKYDITARTLRYYEDMGLLSSTRSDDYAYRMYDKNAISRLEQILILRKLNISIKDIQRIFLGTLKKFPGSNTRILPIDQAYDTAIKKEFIFSIPMGSFSFNIPNPKFLLCHFWS